MQAVELMPVSVHAGWKGKGRGGVCGQQRRWRQQQRWLWGGGSGKGGTGHSGCSVSRAAAVVFVDLLLFVVVVNMAAVVVLVVVLVVAALCDVHCMDQVSSANYTLNPKLRCQTQIRARPQKDARLRSCSSQNWQRVFVCLAAHVDCFIAYGLGLGSGNHGSKLGLQPQCLSRVPRGRAPRWLMVPQSSKCKQIASM